MFGWGDTGVVQECLDVFGGAWLGEEGPLGELAAEILYEGKLVGVFQAVRDDLHANPPPEANRGFDAAEGLIDLTGLV